MKEVSLRVQEHTTQFLAPVESVVRQLQFLIRSGVIDESDFGAMERSFGRQCQSILLSRRSTLETVRVSSLWLSGCQMRV